MRSTRVLFGACVAIVVALLAPPRAVADLITLDDIKLKPESFYNGSDGSGGFLSGGAFFNNDYDQQFQFWKGWSISNQTNVKTPGFASQYSAFALPAGGGAESANYAVAFNFNLGDAYLILPEETRPASVKITNTTYAALSMLLGDMFAKRFGGESGTDPDWFKLTIRGYDEKYQPTGSVDFYLADFRFDDSTLDYVVAEWNTVDLTPLGEARLLLFELSSSDNGPFGMNTPAYFALDSLLVEPRK